MACLRLTPDGVTDRLKRARGQQTDDMLLLTPHGDRSPDRPAARRHQPRDLLTPHGD